MAQWTWNWRRWFGGGALLLALGMLVLGETLLRGSLSPIAYVLYWLVCFFLTGAALLLGAMDASAVRKKTAQEQRELFEETLREIQEDALRKGKLKR